MGVLPSWSLVVWASLGVTGAFPALAAAQQKPLASPRAAASLFADPFAVLQGNRVWCPVYATGELCAYRGLWPAGTPDNYVFNSGLQIAAIVGATPAFAWSGDTVGALFYDARGTAVAGTALTPIYDSRSPADRAAWPEDALALDAAVFHPALLGDTTIGQHDLWGRYWEGSPSRISGRPHPMGLLVEQRAVAWDYPTGNEDIVYFFLTLYNVTARDPAVYANATVPALARPAVARIGALFQDSSEAAFGVSIPDGGYALTQVYLALGMDHDIARITDNHGTISLPLRASVGYTGAFLPEQGWVFPPEIFGALPFYPAPGLIGVTVPRSPADLAIYTNYTGSAVGFPSPINVRQLWRYHSGYVGPADNPCAFGDPAVARARHLCYLLQQVSDSRFTASYGPFTLGPGEATTIVVAYSFAAPLDTVRTTIGTVAAPGIPFDGDSIARDTTKIRFIERIAGWRTQADRDGDGIIVGSEVVTVPRSLLHKAQVAQALVDARFLLPQPPGAPSFYLVPGENQVTVVWQPSATEETGDPYFAIAADPASPLYDPNFREQDVEGYRIYRGTAPDRLELVAQFDYQGTAMLDYTGAFAYAGQCAPELGVLDDCPVAFPASPDPAVAATHPLVGTVVQVPAGARILSSNGLVTVLRADTAVTGGAAGVLPLVDTGVGFAYVDQGVRSGFQYYYAVTAFDVNSVRSGPSSFESQRVVKVARPRRSASNVTAAMVVKRMEGDDGVALDPSAPFPMMDSTTGTFTGIIPPASDGDFGLVAAAVELLPGGDIVYRIDSIVPGFFDGLNLPGPVLHVTLQSARDSATRAFALPAPFFLGGGTRQFAVEAALVRYDTAAVRRFGVTLGDERRVSVRFSGSTISRTSASVAVSAPNLATRYLAHSRWFDDGRAEPAHPTIVGLPHPAWHAGLLTGVARIWAPQADRDRGSPGEPAVPVSRSLRTYSYGQTAWYPADFVVTWNSDASLTVRDSTHHITLPFRAGGGSGYGFINQLGFLEAGVTSADLDDSVGTANVSLVGYHHLYALAPTCIRRNILCVPLERTAQLQQLDFDHDGVADGTGIAFAVNGEVFFMEMAAVPAAGTRWRLRAVTGHMTATCPSGFGPVMTKCDNYTFQPSAVRPSYAPGLRYVVRVEPAYTVADSLAGDLSRVHTVPDPFYIASGYELDAGEAVLRFVNVPSRGIIRIFSQSGILVAVVTNDDPAGGGDVRWDLRSRTGKRVASGVYFFQVEGPGGARRVGRFTVITAR